MLREPDYGIPNGTQRSDVLRQRLRAQVVERVVHRLDPHQDALQREVYGPLQGLCPIHLLLVLLLHHDQVFLQVLVVGILGITLLPGQRHLRRVKPREVQEGNQRGEGRGQRRQHRRGRVLVGLEVLLVLQDRRPQAADVLRRPPAAAAAARGRFEAVLCASFQLSCRGASSSRSISGNWPSGSTGSSDSSAASSSVWSALSSSAALCETAPSKWPSARRSSKADRLISFGMCICSRSVSTFEGSKPGGSPGPSISSTSTSTSPPSHGSSSVPPGTCASTDSTCARKACKSLEAYQA
mmetsp:Transcript_123696/g.395783  ORF Transcript_123696/g.395783 Transcript_123696/m.395783 type:complete len:297 (+) Transcript_123696:2464-3354(+)